jgi:hypothetical protein
MKLIPYFLVVLLAATSCTDVCGCPPTPAIATVRGQVTDSGAPLAGAGIFAAISDSSTPCVVGPEEFLGHSDSEGRYSVTILRAGASESACVFVRARFPAQAPTARDTTLGPFRLSFRYEPPFDSILVNLELPSSP